MNEFLNRIWFNLRRRGLFSLVLLIIYRLFQKVIPFELLILFKKSLLEPIKDLNTRINVLFRKGDLNDIENLDSQEYYLCGLEHHEMITNCECFLGTAGKVVFYIWVDYDNIYDDKIFNIKLTPKQAYLYRAFTHPKFRGLGIYPAGLSHVCKELRKKNIEQCYIATSIENRSSIKGIHKAGFSKVGLVIYLRIYKYRKVILPKVFHALSV